MAKQEILNVRLKEGDRGVVLLDQSQLPNRVEYRTAARLPDMVEAIQSLRVRGAPAIGIFAGYCLYVLARQLMEQGLSGPAFLDELDRQGKVLVSSRPTAVNLAWAVGRLTHLAVRMAGAPVEEIVSALGEEARAIRREDEEMCQKIAEHGLSLLKPGDGVLTHCNAGPLATSKYGTALGPILLGHERGIPLNVFADETRPLLQGARLTAWELQQAGVDVTLICDNMASMVMKRGWPPTGTRPTRSAPAEWPFWPSTTASPSMCWAPPPPSTGPAPTGPTSQSRSATGRRSAPCGTGSPWLQRG